MDVTQNTDANLWYARFVTARFDGDLDPAVLPRAVPGVHLHPLGGMSVAIGKVMSQCIQVGLAVIRVKAIAPGAQINGEARLAGQVAEPLQCCVAGGL